MRTCRIGFVPMCPEFTVLEEIGQRLDLDTRRALFLQDEKADAVYCVAAGMLRLSRLLPDGRRHVTGFALTGDFLGMAATERRSVTAETLMPVSIWQCERQAFMAFVKERPSLLHSLHERAIYELTLAQNQMTVLSRCTADEKVAAFLLGLRERYARIGPISAILTLPMSRQDIADYLGLTIETVSRILTRFDRERIISVVPGGVRLLDLGRLNMWRTGDPP